MYTAMIGGYFLIISIDGRPVGVAAFKQDINQVYVLIKENGIEGADAAFVKQLRQAAPGDLERLCDTYPDNMSRLRPFSYVEPIEQVVEILYRQFVEGGPIMIPESKPTIPSVPFRGGAPPQLARLQMGRAIEAANKLRTAISPVTTKKDTKP